ncbi:hypothetical protein GUITHDRAFT_155735 [Guillardia theta CCMP2712]|uniref:Uncharacterized protein n=1 Tax=Guillardia theta (strain CCMP2712) TaxID=905079 RepID=L1IDX0_GUITC|nr:hypothetical protein GUITHDRAFT_155735 [Guillardia theta CCMP2712]EKX34466.1 hypothetical protein GUITHDRAFT_155735 [Guillardia theta CCMP2712]|eukprot:XP_005821446.1 hypothetical protein GUITHDRAFT_155735 [Guillardia theta CCMP2712]
MLLSSARRSQEHAFHDAHPPPLPPEQDEAGAARGRPRASALYGSGQRISRRTRCLYASGSLLLLYLKLKGLLPFLPWLVVLFPPWSFGLYLLFLSSIPRMLAGVELALGAQHEEERRERNERLERLAWRRGREWEHVEHGCCACGYWGSAVSSIASALSQVLHVAAVEHL